MDRGRRGKYGRGMKESDWCDRLTDGRGLEMVTDVAAVSCGARGSVTSPRVVDSQFASPFIDGLKRIGDHFKGRGKLGMQTGPRSGHIRARSEHIRPRSGQIPAG